MKNRDIRFRAWNKKTKKMFYEDYYTFSFDNSGWSVWEGITSILFRDKLQSMVYHKTGELMQFTGLSDKNGKSIYEGDIVKDEYRSGYSYHQVCFGFFSHPSNDETVYGWFLKSIFESYHPKEAPDQSYDKFTNKGVRELAFSSIYMIIGNIWESPELLKDIAMGDKK